ncbi:hypothetical protein GCM10018781_09790 [Kitasatospora indigofera]|uniref:Uncharacterized protein n=1 Tax=Kitasatospora indigofera TaxID=67307 RepID=A0A919KL38_9ACTN|nr:hypothetical protein GCM10018781_09790 [Kitasatospora indigofera]
MRREGGPTLGRKPGPERSGIWNTTVAPRLCRLESFGPPCNLISLYLSSQALLSVRYRFPGPGPGGRRRDRERRAPGPPAPCED